LERSGEVVLLDLATLMGDPYGIGRTFISSIPLVVMIIIININHLDMRAEARHTHVLLRGKVCAGAEVKIERQRDMYFMLIIPFSFC
jgi:hypothetical protein